MSTQSIVTTHSPLVAASYAPTQTFFLLNTNGSLTSVPLRIESVKSIRSNAIRKLYLQKREAFYEAILGPGVLVPEGEFDHHWLKLLQQLAQCSEDKSGAMLSVAPINIVPTQDSVLETYEEVVRLRPEAVPIVDGDGAGDKYLAAFAKSKFRPKTVIQYGKGAAVECLAAWVLEPSLVSPGTSLSRLLSQTKTTDLSTLQKILSEETKKDHELRESLSWEAVDIPCCAARSAEFFNDIAAIINDGIPTNPGWKKQVHPSGLQVWIATHIHRVTACTSQFSSAEKPAQAKQEG